MIRDIQYLFDILESAKLAISYTTDKNKTAFLNDLQCQDAINRRLIIIGEAANRVSEKTRQSLNHLPWRQMIGMRNIVVHEYADVDLRIIWDTVQTNLPNLVADLESILPSADEV